MKDGSFKSLEIEPTEGYLDFIGPAKSSSSTSNSITESSGGGNGEPPPARVLRGHVKFTLLKPTKIRNISVKFKGFSHITLHQPSQVEITTPLLPKLKAPLLSGKTNLAAGDHDLPWELDIPNIYPRSLLIKRATINYKVIVTISTGLTARTISAEYPIVIRRHLLPYKELAPIIETKLFQKTVPGKFHYEIDAPQIVCIEQDFIPMAIKYISIANQKPVQTIRTRLVQIELYRRQSVSKSESDLTFCNKDSQIFDLDQKIADSNQYKDTHIKYIKRTVPALIHIPDQSTSAWKRPCLVRHRLHPYLSYTLDSPLVSIYHQIEVTFQFGAKYEEIKARIPIIVASIPKRETTTSLAAQQAALSSTTGTISTNTTNAAASVTDEMMMKYAFEEVARSEFLSYRLESRASTARVTDNDDELLIQNDDTYSVLRDTSVMPPTSEEDGEGQITGRVTPMMFVTKGYNGRLPPQPIPSAFYNTGSKSTWDSLLGAPTTTANATHGTHHQPYPRRALSPPPPETNSKHLLGIPSSQYSQQQQDDHRQLKKFASAFDLSTVSQESMMNEEEMIIEERPRTTTPTMKRQLAPRKVLSPINVDLANRKDRGPLPPPPMELPPIPSQRNTTVSETSDSSDVLPAMDRLTLNKSTTTTSQQQSNNNNKRNINNHNFWQHEDDDLRSVYSDTSYNSATNAPSLSSSATLSTNKSYPTLHSRPPSPVFAPAPGLPATTALRSHQTIQQVEEMFPAPPESANSVSSPAMNTVASSTLLSPRTTYALRRRIALSTISSLTNDSSIPGNTRARSFASSLNDPDVQSLMMMSDDYYSNTTNSADMSFYQLPPPPANRYLNARLPPIPDNAAPAVSIPPPRERSSKRLTKIYIDDSDDDEDEEEVEDIIPSLPKVPTTQHNSLATTNSSAASGSSVVINGLVQDDCAPPKLPRLSFGGDFGISLGI